MAVVNHKILTSLKNRLSVEWMVWFLLLAGLAVRMSLARRGIHPGDFNSWVAWGEQLRAQPFSSFYTSIWSDRLPGGILYLLWLLAQIKQIFPFLSNELIYKLPANLADTALAYIIYRFVSARWGMKRGMLAGMLYFFNPFVWHVSALWGQMDSVQALALVLTILLLLRGHHIYSVILFTFIILFKPHSIVIAPLLLVYVWVARSSLRNFLSVAATMLVTAVSTIWVLSWPFAAARINQREPWSIIVEPFRLVWERFDFALDLYPYGSVHAFNLWMAFGQNWRPDTALFWNVSYHAWGIFLFGIFSIVALLLVLRSASRSPTIYLLAASGLSLFAFTFLTRAHDKHVFPFFALFVFTLFDSRVPYRVVIYGVMSVLAVTNSIYSYAYQYGGGPPLSEAAVGMLSLLPVAVSYYVLRELERRVS